MPGDMNLRHAVRWNAIYICKRVEVVILRRDVNVIYIEQNAAIRPLHHFIQKLPLGHFRNVKLRIAAHLFHHHRSLDKIPHFANFLRRDARRFECVRHRQQVVRVAAIDATPAEMIGNPWRLGAFHQFLQSLQMFAIWFLRRAEIHRNAMLHHSILLENLVEDAHRTPAIDHEILRNNFEPVHDRFLGKNVVVVRSAQPDSHAVVSESVEPICRHLIPQVKTEKERGPENSCRPSVRWNCTTRASYLSAGILEPSVAQPPLPLQEFLPLQPLSLDLQPPLPLQEFWPLQACFSFAFLSASCKLKVLPFALDSRLDACTVTAVPANKPASAAPATKLFLDFVIFPHPPVNLDYNRPDASTSPQCIWIGLLVGRDWVRSKPLARREELPGSIIHLAGL